MNNEKMLIGTGAVIVLLFGLVLLYRPHNLPKNPVKTISQWEMDGQPVSLPRTFSGYAPREALTLTTQILPEIGDCLYVKTVYLPIKLYADEKLIFEYGETGTYPPFLLDPPTKVALVSLPPTDTPINLRLEYQFPSQRNSAILHPVLLGTSGAILIHLFSQMGFSLFFSLVLIALGILLALIALILTRVEKGSLSFFWLGLFAFCVGTWVLGECNLTGIFVNHPSFLYLMAFTGLFTLAIPLMKFGLIILKLHQDKPLRWMCLIQETAVCVALLLQLFGIVALAKSMYLFHFLIPLALSVFCGCILYESIRYQNPMARRFFLPISVLVISALLEVSNYYWFLLPVQKSFFFQIGVLLFIFMVSIICGYFVRDIFTLKLQNHQLSYEISLMEKQIEVQTERHRLFSETSAQIQRQRHDLKHHLAVIQDFLYRQETEQLAAYLDKLSAAIPDTSCPDLCENKAVNAVALHYQSIAHKLGISSCSICLDIPKDAGKISDNELCVIVGNLLENAVTACKGTEKPFIRMQSRLADGILTITMDNRCQRPQKLPDGSFLSSKKEGGIGLVSIRSVAEKYGGGSRFEVQDDVFFSSVYLHLF